LNSVKRWGAFAVAVAAIVVGIAQPAVADDTCDAAACHRPPPSCWTPPRVALRPQVNRAVVVDCSNANTARMTAPPAHVAITDVSVDWRGLHFHALPDDDAPRYDAATFELENAYGTTEVQLPIEVIPLSENHAPTCWVPDVWLRTDGTGPATVSPWPYCDDPDNDEFQVEGGGPGVHLDTPKPGPDYDGYDWRYRTVTSSGSEKTRIWATDFLGARSADSEFTVTVGPGVDRPPMCGSVLAGTQPIYARPGAVRRFGVFCWDDDGDPFVPRLSSPPQRGALVPVPMEPYSYGGSYYQQSVDATYAPADDSLEPDPFSFTASGTRGDGPPQRMAIVPRPLPDNGGGYCDWGSAMMTTDVPGKVSARCTDDEGDPLSAEIVLRPRHGTAGPPVVTETTFGAQEITIPFVSEAGFEGFDCVKVKVTDGHGFETEFTIDISVFGTPPGWDPSLPPLPPWPAPPLGPPPGYPPSGYPPPRFGAPNARAAAQQSLGTTAVKRVHRDGGSEVWARSKLSKGDLLRDSRSPALAVICLRDCQIRSGAALSGVPRLRASRRKAVAQRRAGEAHVVTLDLTRAEQRALRRARRPRATFNLNVRAAGGRAWALRRSIPIGR
jgi:hypothetical protein